MCVQKKQAAPCRATQLSNDCYSFQRDSYLPTHFYLHTSVVYYFPHFFPIFPMSSSLNLIWIQFFSLVAKHKMFLVAIKCDFSVIVCATYMYMFNVYMHRGVSCCMWGCKCGTHSFRVCCFFLSVCERNSKKKNMNYNKLNWCSGWWFHYPFWFYRFWCGVKSIRSVWNVHRSNAELWNYSCWWWRSKMCNQCVRVHVYEVEREKVGIGQDVW